MSKAKNAKEVEEVAEVVEEVETEEVAVDTEVEETPAKKKSKFPEVAGTGKFQAVQVGKGFVVYNPHGQRVSDVLEEVAANDLVRDNNQAAHLK